MCHNHFCFFNGDQEAINEGTDWGSYDCWTDEGKLWPVFTNCNVLLLEGFDASMDAIECGNQPRGGGPGGVTSHTKKDTNHVGASNEGEMG